MAWKGSQSFARYCVVSQPKNRTRPCSGQNCIAAALSPGQPGRYLSQSAEAKHPEYPESNDWLSSCMVGSHPSIWGQCSLLSTAHPPSGGPLGFCQPPALGSGVGLPMDKLNVWNDRRVQRRVAYVNGKRYGQTLQWPQALVSVPKVDTQIGEALNVQQDTLFVLAERDEAPPVQKV